MLIRAGVYIEDNCLSSSVTGGMIEASLLLERYCHPGACIQVMEGMTKIEAFLQNQGSFEEVFWVKNVIKEIQRRVRDLLVVRMEIYLPQHRIAHSPYEVVRDLFVSCGRPQDISPCSPMLGMIMHAYKKVVFAHLQEDTSLVSTEKRRARKARASRHRKQ